MDAHGHAAARVHARDGACDEKTGRAAAMRRDVGGVRGASLRQRQPGAGRAHRRRRERWGCGRWTRRRTGAEFHSVGSGAGAGDAVDRERVTPRGDVRGRQGV